MDAEPTSLWAVFAVAVSALLGLSIAQGWMGVVLLLLAPILVVMISFGREVSIEIVMLSVCSFVYAYAYPQIAIGGVRVTWAEVALIACVAASTLALLREGPGFVVRFRTDIALVGLMVVASIAGIAVSVAHGTDAKLAIMSTRGVLYYAACIPAVVALGSPESRRRVIRFVVWLALVMGVAQVVQTALGTGVQLIVTGGSANIIGLDQATEFLRVRSPGLPLIYLVASFALASLLWGPRTKRVASAWVFGVTISGVLVSLNRNMLIGLAAGVLLAALFSRNRTRAMVIFMSVALAVTVVLVAASGFAARGIVGRLASLGDYGALVQSTLSDRYYENGLALSALSSSPIVGLGWGADYGARISGDSLSELSLQPRGWIHNQYLGLWLRTGLLGLFCAIALLVRAVIAGLAWSKRAPDDSAWIGLGLVVAIVSFSASAMAGMYFVDPDSIVPLVGLLALGFVLRNLTPKVSSS